MLVDSRRGINNHDATMMDTLNKTFIPYQVCEGCTNVGIISAYVCRIALTNMHTPF